jgi:hypothetical protein
VQRCERQVRADIISVEFGKTRERLPIDMGHGDRGMERNSGDLKRHSPSRLEFLNGRLYL